MLITGTLLAWAVSLRLASNILFAVAATWMSLCIWWWCQVLTYAGCFNDQHFWDSGSLAHSTQQSGQQASKQSKNLQKRQTGLINPLALEDASARQDHHNDMLHKWVESAALHAVQCSPPASTCSSITSPQRPTVHQKLHSLESCSTGRSSADSTSQVVSGIAKAAEQRMLHMLQGSPNMHEVVPAAAGVWATSVLLARRISQSGSGKCRRASAGVCPPPLEYEASAELQQKLEAAAPDEFMCPIGRVLMVDPVFTPSGFTYHRPCIMAYINRTGRDPAQDTSTLLPSQLCPNVNLRDQIARWLQRQGVQT